MITHKPGHCYEMSFDDGQVIAFKYLGGSAVGPMVEIDGAQHNLHSLMAGHTLQSQRLIPCDPDELSQGLTQVYDGLTRTQDAINQSDNVQLSNASMITSVREEAMSALQRIAAFRGNHNALPDGVLDAESKLKAIIDLSEKLSRLSDVEARNEKFEDIVRNFNGAVEGFKRGIEILQPLT